MAYDVRNGSIPSVLLVHDAFADTSIWAATIAACSLSGTDCVAVANPLRGLAADAGYVAALAASIDGPVVLVGHGYGGAVASVAAAASPNVAGLACVAGFAPDAGENCVGLLAPSALFEALRPRRIGDVTELTIDRARYPEIFAADVDPGAARAAAACQRPVVAGALDEPAAVAGWRGLPVWYLVATADRLLPAENQRAMAARAGATTFETDASHAVAMSRPEAVASLIAAATAR